MDQLTKNFLMHHGVLGMHWGIRKKREASRSDQTKKLTPNQKRLLVGGSVIAGAGLAVASVYLYKKYGIKPVVKIPKGTVFQNVNTYGDNLNLNKHTYLTFKPHDNELYLKKFGSRVLDSSSKGQGAILWKTSLKSKETIRTPTIKEAQRLYDNWSKSVPKSDDVFFHPDHRVWLKHTSVNGGVVDAGPGSFTEYLKKKGYNGLIDSFDKEMSNMTGAQMPIMVFDGYKTLSNTGSEFVKARFGA